MDFLGVIVLTAFLFIVDIILLMHLKSQQNISENLEKEKADCLDESQGGRWIPCSKRMPDPEEEVFILTSNGTMTTAMYEDGTVYVDDSIWIWNDHEFEYDEDMGDCIIHEGWWEYRHFNSDDVSNNVVNEEVVAWQPLPSKTL